MLSREFAGVSKTLAVASAGVLALLLSVGAQAGSSTDPSPVPFRLVFEGARLPDLGAANIRHEGIFSATAPVCAAGNGSDQEVFYPFGAVRENTCADGSGRFTAILEPVQAERGGAGSWRIVGGTGRYAGLRGRGTLSGELTSGSPSEEGTVTFRSTWTGLVGFDAVAPGIRIVRATARRVQRKPGVYVLRVVFRVQDDVPGNAVEYRVLPTSGSYLLPFAEGRAKNKSVSVTLQVRQRRSDLPILVEIRVSDPLGNERRTVRSVPLQP